MCGISGILNFSKKKIENEITIKKLVLAQHKRGPDSKGYWISDDNKITLGHNRLSIIDLSEDANQPFLSRDGNYVIIFNGEIYNFQEVKNELSKKNIFFRTSSDTEVIIEAYKYWGVEFIKLLRGMFAFCIFDKFKKKIILARDPFGIKPLYYTRYNNIFYFSSEIKALLKIKEIPYSISKAANSSYFLWGHIQEPYTLYNEIKSLKKGSLKIIDSTGNEKNINYASIKEVILNTESKKISNIKEANSLVKYELNKSLNYHTVSDVPLTLLLSSGIDSNVLLSSASMQEIKRLDALTLDFQIKGSNNETELSKKSTSQNKIHHITKKFLETEIVNEMENFFNSMDSPTSDGLNNFLISKEVKKNGKKVMISGVGADEIFCGYPSFQRIPKIFQIFKFIPSLNIKNGSHMIKIMNKFKINPKFLGLFKYNNSYEKIFFLQRCLFMPEELNFFSNNKILNEGFEELNLFENLYKDVKEFKNDVSLLMYLEIENYLCSRILRDSDWASMANSVEMRTPYVDWFFFKNILPIVKSKIVFEKKQLLDIYSKNLPNELYRRKKTGFDIPYNKYYSFISKNKKNFNKSQKNWAFLSMNKYLEINQ